MENIKILDTFISVDPVSQNAATDYNQYKAIIQKHLEGLGFKWHKNCRVKISRKHEIYLWFYIARDYDLDNMIKRFTDILRHYLNADDVNTVKINAQKKTQPITGIKVKVYERNPFKEL